ncbi:uncharacterized protein LOC115596791 [Sparus aurata]|uniref:uncharacterized protein LOC115596791 n=1 Tax=Sparus aurata TaxID=8175 RepID=UPI0011C136A3|nr:uncharacterized protein LOC115596791 [Sparus aurata]
MLEKQKKLAVSKLQHDDSYLKSIPKTSYYLFPVTLSRSEIFDLQRQLAQSGHLNTHHDMEDFYRRIEYGRHPSQLHKSLEAVRKQMLGSRSASDLMTSEKLPCAAEDGGHQDLISSSRILDGGSGLDESSAELIFGGSQDKEDFERMFPKTKAPTFATLQPNFMRNFQSKMPDLIIPEIPEKSRKAQIYLRRLRQMHDLCLANMAFTHRLLDRETDSPRWQEERGNHDLFPVIDTKHEKTRQTNEPPLCSPKQLGSVQNDGLSCPKLLSKKTSSSLQSFETPVLDKAACCRKTPDPLSIEDLCQQKHIQVTDREVKLWRNYIEDTDH